MDWIEIKMEVQDREAVDGISNMLAEMGTGGVMIEDPQGHCRLCRKRAVGCPRVQ